MNFIVSDGTLTICGSHSENVLYYIIGGGFKCVSTSFSPQCARLVSGKVVVVGES